MGLERAESGSAANRSKRAIGARGDVRQLSAGVAADAVAAEEMNAEIEFFLEERPPHIDADASAGARVVEGAEGARSRASIRTRVGDAGERARIEAIAEGAEDAKDFVMAETRIECRF